MLCACSLLDGITGLREFGAKRGRQVRRDLRLQRRGLVRAVAHFLGLDCCRIRSAVIAAEGLRWIVGHLPHVRRGRRLRRQPVVFDLNLRRALALLVYLAVTGRPQGRETLGALLWPDSDEREA